MSTLRELSDAAAPGRLYVAESTELRTPPEVENDWDCPFGGSDHGTLTGPDGEGSLTITTDPAFAGWVTDGGFRGYGLSRANATFLAELWNAYRDGRLIDAE